MLVDSHLRRAELTRATKPMRMCLASCATRHGAVTDRDWVQRRYGAKLVASLACSDTSCVSVSFLFFI